MLTERMMECLIFIESHIAERGISPTMQEICAGIELSSKSKARAAQLVAALEKRGLIRRVRLPDGKVARRGILLVRQACPHCGGDLSVKAAA